MGRAGLNRKTALTTATLTLAAEAPDLDVLANVKGSVFGFAHHRGFTHSFLGVPLVAALVVGFMYGLWRLRGRRTRNANLPPRWGLLFGFACLAGLSHILLDYTNNYGVRPFWPFYERWYSWDIVFIVEPALLLLMIAGLALPSLFGLINEEIGVPRSGPKGRLGASLALLGIVAVWGVRDYEHGRAVVAMQARTYQGVVPLRVSAYPYWWNPFRWYGVAETPAFFAQVSVNSRLPEVDPARDMRIRYKPEETPVTLAAKSSYLGRVYLDWAQYPITETQMFAGGPSDYAVRFRDLRYDYPGSGRATLSATVILNSERQIVSQDFGLRRSSRLQAPPSR